MLHTSLCLIPDSILSPMGGMGVQLKGLITGAYKAEAPIYFKVVGSSGPSEEGPNYVFQPHSEEYIVQFNAIHSMSAIAFAQSSYVDKALTMGQEVDLVHAFDWSTGYAGMIVARRLGVPLVTTFQLSMAAMALSIPQFIKETDMEYANMVLAIEHQMIVSSAEVIQVSDSYANFWRNLMPIYANKMVVIPNAAEQIPQEIFERPSYLKKGYNIGYIGRCCVQKAADLIINSVASDDWPPNTTLYWAGNGKGGIPQLWTKLNEAAKCFPERLVLVGYLSGNEKWAFMQYCDGILFPSRHEPFGIVGMEALAVGTPLLTSRVDGIGSYATDANSIFCPPTVPGILKAIELLISIEEEERKNIVSAGIATARKYSWENIALQLAGCYKRVTR